MDNARWERIQTIFHEAAARPESERQAFLETACAGDAQMIAEVSAMLQADGRAASLLDRGLSDIAYRMVGASLEPAASREFGPYRLTRILGEGGMGVVWLAEREDAGNLVAVKFLPHAGLSPARRERFGREIKTLAKLRHPFIARLYDAGTLADGTPWFVMEYVQGAGFIEYCRAQERPIAERLRLFRMVCEAVQYAHGQEIIHRDLKPSNILVEQDGTPRLLDFGIARELQSMDEPADQTRPGLRFLSPDYAAPEWVRDGSVGLYTDVYSLGVILYEMLAGRLPFDRSKPAAEENGRHTIEYGPSKPSAVACAYEAIGSTKHVSSLSKAAWADLDVLCLKAMHRDARERYQSVEALIRDIDHYLKAEPLEARPDTMRYRLGKFVQRNRRAVVATTLTAALVVSLIGFFTVRLAKARDTALAEAARTRRIQRFMLDLFGAADKGAAPSNDLRVLTLLDRGAQQAPALHADPETQAELYQNLGSMYSMLGKVQKSDELLHLSLEKMKLALGPENPKVADSLIQIGLLRNGQAQFKDAERLVREGLNLLSRRLPANDSAVLKAKSLLGVVLTDSGAYDKAIAVLEPLVKIPPAGEEGMYTLLGSLTPLAAAEHNTGHLDLAESLNRRALVLARQLFGNSHPRVAFILGELGGTEATSGRYQEAENSYREAVKIDKAWYGQNHSDTALFTNFLALVLIQENKFDEASPLLQQVLAIQEQTYGKIHPYVAVALDTLGTLERNRGNLAEAEAYCVRAIAIDRTLYGDNNHQTSVLKAHLAQVYVKMRQDQQAEPLLREAVGALTARPLPGNLSVGVAQLLLGEVLLRQKHYDEAAKYLAAGYAILLKGPGKSSATRVREARQDLVTVYEALKMPEKASEFRTEPAANEPRKADLASGH